MTRYMELANNLVGLYAVVYGSSWAFHDSVDNELLAFMGDTHFDNRSKNINMDLSCVFHHRPPHVLDYDGYYPRQVIVVSHDEYLIKELTKKSRE
jgi:hypothetical protein